MLGVLVWAGPGVDGNALRVSTLTLLTACLAVRGMLGVHEPMRAEFGPSLAWVTHVPAMLAAALLLGRSAWALGQPGELIQLDHALFNRPTVTYALMIAAASIHFAYGGMLATRLSRRLVYLSQHDGLTGVLNRAAGAEQLKAEWQRFQRSRQPFAVLMLDADHFKAINDQHGHAAGDQVLVGLSLALQRQLRPIDSLARMGGEEFMLILPGVQGEGARAAAERMRQSVQDYFMFQPSQLTVSIGWTLVDAVDADPAQVMARADKAMYLAKAGGRNRVEELLAADAGSATG
jgi:diguanylate cyclase (GGDEF)-like protein